MPRLLVLLFVFLIGIGSVSVEARELSSEKLSHRIQALQEQITSIQNNTLRASLYSVEELQEELNTLINLSRLEDKLTVVRVNREHPSVELHLADIERTTMDTPIKKRVAEPQKLTLIRPPTTQPTTQKVALKKPVPQTRKSAGWMPVSDTPVQVALVDPLSAAGTRPRYAESRGAVAEEPVKDKSTSESRWTIDLRPMAMRQLEGTKLFASVNNGTTAALDHGAFRDMDASFGTGVEVELAYKPQNTHWHFAANARHFENSDKVTRGYGPSRNANSTDYATFAYGVRGKFGNRFEFGSSGPVSPIILRETVWGTLDLDARYDFKNSYNLHSITGLRLAYIDRILGIHAFETQTNNPEFVFAKSSQNGSYFRGLGPRVGFSFEKTYKHGFGIDGEISGAFLIGVSEVVASMVDTTACCVLPRTYIESELKAVPTVDGKFGVHYRNNIKSYAIDIGAGISTLHWLGLNDFMNDMQEEKNEEVAGSKLEDQIVGFFGPYFKAKVTW